MFRAGHAVPGAGLIVFLLLLSPAFFDLLFYARDFFYVEVGHRCAWNAAQAAGSFGLDGIYGTVGNGVPVWAHPSSQLFYPPRWLTASFAPQFGAHLDVVLHLSASASAAAWLFLKFRSPPLLALAGALTWILSGSVLDLISKSETTIGALWLPLAWAAVRSALYDRAAWGWPLTGLAVGLAFLGGDPVCVILIASVVGVEILTRPGPKHLRSWSVLATGLAAGVGGVLIGLLQWLPTLSEVALGRRGTGLPAKEVLMWSFSPSLWPAAVAPGLMRAGGTEAWLVLQTRDQLPLWSEQPYLGWLPILAAGGTIFYAMRRRRRRWWLAPTILTVVWLFLATAKIWPGALTVVELLPGAASLRFPMKFLPAVGLASLVLFAIQQRRWQRFVRLQQLRALLKLGAISVGLLGLGFGVVALSVGGLDPMAAATGWWRSILLGALPLGLAWLLVTRNRIKWLPLVLVIDGLLLLPQHLEVGPPIVDAATPLEALKNVTARPVICRGSIMNRASISEDIWSNQVMQRFWAIPELTSCNDLVSPFTYTQPLVSRTAMGLVGGLGDPQKASAAARALGCTHILSPEPPVGIDGFDALPGEAAIRSQGEPKAWRVPGAIVGAVKVTAPRLTLESEVVSKVITASTQQETLAVVDDPDHRLPPGTIFEATPSGKAQVQGVGGRRLNVTVEGEGLAVVAISQAYARGWSASQAGKSLPVVRIAGQLLGVVTPHVESGLIELEYRAPHKRVALVSGFAGMLGLAIFWALLRRRRPTAQM